MAYGFQKPRFGGQPGLLYGLFGMEPAVWVSYGFLPIANTFFSVEP